MGAALTRCCDPDVDVQMSQTETNEHTTQADESFLRSTMSKDTATASSNFWEDSPILTMGDGNAFNSELQFDTKAGRHFSILSEQDDYYYILPTDEIEAKRLEFQHQVMRSILRTNFAAPLRETLQEGLIVLDVGTGPGTWIIDMAKQFPKSHIYGIDANDYCASPKGRELPSNATFERGNVISGLSYADDTFDYVHQRFLAMALTRSAWPLVIKELLRVTKPGGYVELVECHVKYMNPGPAFQKLSDITNTLFRKKGIDVHASAKVGKMEIEAGLENVKTSVLQLPIGKAFGGPIGQAWLENLKTTYHGLKPALSKYSGLRQEEVEQIMQRAWEECNERQICSQFSIAVGKKSTIVVPKEDPLLVKEEENMLAKKEEKLRMEVMFDKKEESPKKEEIRVPY